MYIYMCVCVCVSVCVCVCVCVCFEQVQNSKLEDKRMLLGNIVPLAYPLKNTDHTEAPLK